MQVISDPKQLRTNLIDARRHDPRPLVALVPTMGNLHAGHLSLVEKAKQIADVVVVSIFVNPLQFAPHEDFDQYPRTLEADLAQLDAVGGVDYVLTPDIEGIYPGGDMPQTVVRVPGLSDELCGASRPGFFEGVTTIVAKLFHCVSPDMAVFGQKDFQQSVIVKTMVQGLNFPIDIVTAPIVREADGLAMSSRNQYLSVQERKVAPRFHEVLVEASQGLAGYGEDAWKVAGPIEMVAKHQLAVAGFHVDYVSVRARAHLQLPKEGDRELIVLGAVSLGSTRLIDNIFVDI